MLRDVAFTKVSARGQMVIPKELRAKYREGDKLMIIQEGDALIIKNANTLGKHFQEDIMFAKAIEKGWRDFRKGDYYKATDEENFFDELREW